MVETAAATAPTLTFVAASGTVYQIALDTGTLKFAETALSILLQVQPANDHFTNRFTLSGLATAANGANVLATQEPDESLPGGASGKTFWRTWSAPTNVLVRFSTAGSHFDGGSVPLPVNPVASISGPLLAVYSGDTLTNLSLLASNSILHRELPHVPPPNQFWDSVPELSFVAATGGTFQISVDGLNGGSGFVTLNLTALPNVPPVNDDFAERIAVSGVTVSVTTSNRFATKEPGEQNHAGDEGGASVWWAWTAPASGPVRLSASGSIPVLLGVYRGDAVDNLTEVTAGTGEVEFYALVGVAYDLAFDGAAGAEGEFAWNLALTLPPTNDSFSGRTLLAGSQATVVGTVAAATREPGEPEVQPSPVGGTVWYSWRAAASGTVTLTVDDGYGIGVYAGSSVSRLLTIAQGESVISFYASAGFEYAIALDDFNGFRTDFGLVLNGPPTPPVLDPSSARRLSDGSFGLLIAGTNAQTFAVQASTNLVDWTTVLIDTLLGNSQDFVDSEAGSLPWRFYRVVPLEAVLGSPRLHVGPGQFDGSGAFSVRVIGSGGQPFTFQASTNLVNWTDLTRDNRTQNALEKADGSVSEYGS